LNNEPLYIISVVSRVLKMHPQTLRKYERAGLIRPSRSAGSHRFYSPADVARLRRIQYLVEERGLNVAGVEMALGMTDHLDALAPTSTAEELRTAIDEATRRSRVP